MQIKVIIVTIILFLLLVIILQNTQPVALTLLVWNITLPFIIMLIVIFAIGFICGMLFTSIKFHKKQKTPTTMETHRS